MLSAITHATIDELIQDLVLIATLAGLIWGFFKLPVKRWQNFLHRRSDNREKLNVALSEVIPNLLKSHEDTHASLDFIMSELKPNHGTSLKDAVTRIEKMMYKSDAVQRGLMSQDSTPLFLTDEQGLLIWCNAAYLDLVNRDTMELLGKGYLNVVERSKQDEIRIQATAALMDKRDMILYFNVETEDPLQPYIPVEVNATPMIGFNDKLEGYIGSIRRLDDHYSSYSDLKRIEEILTRVEGQVSTNVDAIAALNKYHKDRETIVEEILESVGRVELQAEKNEAMIRSWWAQEARPMYMNDVLGNCTWVNTAMVDICGYDSTQLLGKGWLIIVHTKDKARLVKEIQEAIPEKREVIAYYTLVSGDPDVGQFDVKAISIPLFDKSGEVIGYIGTLSRLDQARRKEDRENNAGS